MIYLGNQSTYSFLQSMISIEKLIHESKSMGYSHVTLHDENLHGMLQFFQYAKTYQIKPIIGCRITVCMNDVNFETYISIKNQLGYLNMLKIMRKYDSTSINIEDLISFSKGLSLTFYVKSNSDQFIEHMSLLKAHEIDVYIGLHVFDIDVMDQNLLPFNDLFIPIYKPTHIEPFSKETLSLIEKIGTKKIDRHDMLITEKKLFEFWPKNWDASDRFQATHSFILTIEPFGMPLIPLEKNVTAKEYFISLSRVGLTKRLKKHHITQVEVYKNRLEYEIQTIIKMGFERYFLIVFDLIKFAKNQNILVGPGRGSAAGSLVAFVLGITDIDPIKFNLLFERFLNPQRISMPDIDMDFPDDKRDLIIDYACKRFGHEHIASIVTFQTYALKSALRDILKAMNIESNRAQYLTHAIIKNEIDQQDRQMMMVLKHVEQLLGMPRQTGTHAAGIIFSEKSLFETIPLYQGPFDFFQTQWEAKELESIGLLKMDFLGLRNLTIISKTIEYIHKTESSFDILSIPLDDKKTYEYLSLGNTHGIFQLESDGMKQTLIKLKPEIFEDIVVLLALYRPGPMAFIDTYIERKNGKSFDSYHDSIASILEPTYGIIVYQEQIMQIAQVFAGYSLAEADLLRRGIAKKEESILLKEETNFISKSSHKGRSNEDSKKIYDLILRFSDYGFNRSHSVSYAMIAYQMAYLKINYTEAFMTALLDSVIGNDLLTHQYLDEMKQFGFQILSPNIHTSQDTYEIKDRKIIPPLSIIKSIHHKISLQILEKRNQFGFHDYQQFKKNMLGIMNESQLEKLIFANALENFGDNKKTLFENRSLKSVEYYAYVDNIKMPNFEEYPFEYLMNQEILSLGFNITYDVKEILNAFKLDHLDNLQHNDVITIAGMITQKKEIKTKKGDTMAFVQVFDGQTYLEATIFPQNYKKFLNLSTTKYFKLTIEKSLYKDKEAYSLNNIQAINI